ncbi:ABC transporter ATP-binding protein [Hyphomicrobium sp. MC1]|uniref:ABC transporter ATP-binding protein n=1 Tax=Hyphomicrobium sp. (strain MC1) TaxID=717785 RepID=UPI000213E91E|nr:ATP-binding cassette domain-containing protein [Hyphomicrobium sp. MC1]CCB66586.1 ABC transporter related protein [Hyphomicrobium sp. MC1]
MSLDQSQQLPLVEVQNVNLSFGGIVVLNNINLSIRESEVVALIGPNGAGKSAFLNCISGVYPTKRDARISLDNVRLDRLAAHRRARVGVSRTFQGLNLISSHSVLDNVLLGLTTHFALNVFGTLARPWAALRAEKLAREEAFEILNLCGLQKIWGERCSDLPFGLLRRVDLARALIGRPKLLLLDEPASGLSHDERPLIGQMVRLALTRKKLAVLWIEHDLDLVFSEARRAIVLHHGEQIDEGNPGDANQRARLIESYKNGRLVD